MPMAGWLILAILGVLAVVALVGAYRSYQRTEAIKSIAVQLAFHFIGQDSGQIPTLAWHLELCSKGRSRRVYNLIRGQYRDARVFMFDYSYRVGRGKRSHMHQQTVVLFDDPELTLPRFVLIPETIFHRLGGLFGNADIDFPDYPEFSKRYLLRGEDALMIRRWFTISTMRFYQDRPGVNTEGMGNLLLYCYFHRLCPPQEWSSFLDEALEAYGRFKDLDR